MASGVLHMATWHRITIAAAMVCIVVLGIIGSGWLARGSNADPNAAQRISDEIALIQRKLDVLAKDEEAAERKMSAETIKAQMQLIERQEQMGLNEKEAAFKRQQTQERIKTAALRQAQVEEQIQGIIDKGNPDQKHLDALRQKQEIQ